MMKHSKNKKSASVLKRIKNILPVAAIFLVFAVCVISFTNTGKQFWKNLSVAADMRQFPGVVDEYPLNIYFMDVGKADAILLECDGEYALLDAGTYESGSKVEMNLLKRGVTELKYVFASHPDSDHIGGMARILHNFSVLNLVEPDIPEGYLPSSDEYKNLRSAVEKTGVNTVTAVFGQEFILGGASIKVLSLQAAYTDVNDYSIVLRLTYGDKAILFCGDIEKEAEDSLVRTGVDLSADVIKIAHHGSKTSSTEAFLSAVGAEYAVICTGADNNNLPRAEVLQRLESFHMKIYRTDIEGLVICSTDGNDLIFTTENNG